MSSIDQKESPSQINTLQVLRALAFVGVMLSHTGFKALTFWGGWGVSIFIVLSGFIMTFSYYNKNRLAHVSFVCNGRFAWQKISKLYPLYVTTTLLMMPFLFLGEVKSRALFLRVLFNAALIQEYFPLYGRSINAVAWYLCVAMLSYFLFPWILHLMEESWSIKKSRCAIVASIAAIIMVGVCGSLMPDRIYDAASNVTPLWTDDFTSWFTYKFPFSRVIEFFIGCNIGYIYIHINHDRDVLLYTGLELAAITFTLLEWGILLWVSSDRGETTTAIYPDLWWINSLLVIPSSMLLVYSFAVGKGEISVRLVNRVSLYLARISSSGFLIHYVIFRYIHAGTKVVNSIAGKEYISSNATNWITATFGVVLTLVACEAWMCLWPTIGSCIAGRKCVNR